MGMAAEILVWWILMVGVWDITISGTTLADIAAAGGAGLLSAIFAVATRRVTGGPWRPSLRPLRWAPAFVGALLADFVRVLWYAARHAVHRDGTGEFVVQELQRVEGLEPATHRAVSALTVSATPGNFVVDTDEDAHLLVQHEIVSGSPDLGKVVRR